MPRFVFVKNSGAGPQYGVEPISLTVGRPQIRSGDVPNNGNNTYGFRMNWIAVTNAVKYKVYRATSINGPWDLVATVNAPTVTYTDSPFSFGALRLYRVAAVREQGSSSTGSDGKAPPTTYAQTLLYTHEGTMSNYIQFQGLPAPRPRSKPTHPHDGTAQTTAILSQGRPRVFGLPETAIVVTINWVAMEGVDSIRIYRNGTPIGFAGSALSTRTLTIALPLRGYGILLQVAGIVGGVEYEKSDPLVVWTKPSAPTNVTATAPNDQQQPVSLVWTAPTGATGYKIYRDGAYLEDSATNSYLDATTVWGTGYEYQVSATNSAGEGPKSLTFYVTTDPAAPIIQSATSSGTSVTLTWSAPFGADKYYVYRDGSLVQTVYAPIATWTDTGGTMGSTYTYSVSAVNLANEEGPLSGSSLITLNSAAITSAGSPATATLLSGRTYYYTFLATSGTNTITFAANTQCDLLVVGGGGSGGGSIGGGGGAGGAVYMVNKTFASNTTYTITVGSGGVGRVNSYLATGASGGASSIRVNGATIQFDGLSVEGKGGGYGGSYYDSSYSANKYNGTAGGSGGGGSDVNDDRTCTGGGSTQGATYWNADTSSYIAGGSDGRSKTTNTGLFGAGGGGMGSADANYQNGYSGIQNSITGSALWAALPRSDR
eukprot:tig00021111_g18397.t1